MAIQYVHSTADGNITVKWMDTGITNEIHVDDTIANLVVQDLINACRAAEASIAGFGFPQIAAASGKEVLGTGVTVGITLQLLGGWRVYSKKTSGVFTVLGGNLVKGDGSSPFRPNNSITYVNVLSASSTIVTAGGGGSGSFTDNDRANLVAAKTNTDSILSLLTAMNTIAELASPPGVTATLPDCVAWLTMLACNLMTETDSIKRLFKRDNSTLVGTWPLSDPTPGAGGTFTRGKVN